MWAPKGQQPRVPAPGKNEKKVVYGGVDYATGRITTRISDTKSGLGFIYFLEALLRTRDHRKILLICDNARYHHTQAVHDWLERHRRWIEVIWLPPYCPDLNLIELIWGHLKRIALANVLFTTIDDLVAAFQRGVQLANVDRNKLGFVFNHDDVMRQAA